MSRPVDRTLPFVFEPTCKVVAINYPDDPDRPGCLEFCGEHWEQLLKAFFMQKRYARFGVQVDTDNGMTAKAIEVSFDYKTPDETIKNICEEAIKYMKTQVKPIYKRGHIVTLNTQDYELRKWNGQEVTVLGLDEDNDIDENGFKYALRTKDGEEIYAFQFELR